MSGAIWLASYPRSGNTWTRMALYSIRNDGGDVDFNEIAAFGSMVVARQQIDRLLEIDTALLRKQDLDELRADAYAIMYNGDGEGRLTKIHDAWIRTPSGRPVFDKAITQAAIYLIRDPRDVAVSWARFTGRTIAQSIDFLCNHKAMLAAPGRSGSQLHQPMGSWSDHVVSWVDESGLEPLIIRYEDQLADPAASLQAMTTHIGWNASPRAVAGAIEKTRFEQLAAKERREVFLEVAPLTERFFHTGQSGGWRSVLTAEQAARLEREHRVTMRRFGYL